MCGWFRCYVGTNSLRGSKGIYVIEVDPAQGDMRIISVCEAENSAYICLSPGGRYLYAVMESLEYEGTPGGGIASYKIHRGVLEPLNRRYAYGGWPCHVAMDEIRRLLYVSVFRNGLWAVYPLEENGAIGEPVTVKQHSEPNGTPSHIHASVPTPDGNYAAAADCGLDCIYLYDAVRYRRIYTWQGPKGSGPRQLAFSKDGKYLYMVSELSCEVFVFAYRPEDTCMLQEIQRLSTRRLDGYEGPNYASAIHIHPSGNFVLAGNRGHNSIAVYSRDPVTGMLKLLSHAMLAGDHCREFCFTPDGKLLVAGIQHTDVVQTFFFNEDTGRLTWTGKELEIPSPSCVIMGLPC